MWLLLLLLLREHIVVDSCLVHNTPPGISYYLPSQPPDNDCSRCCLYRHAIFMRICDCRKFCISVICSSCDARPMAASSLLAIEHWTMPYCLVMGTRIWRSYLDLLIASQMPSPLCRYVGLLCRRLHVCGPVCVPSIALLSGWSTHTYTP